MRLIPDGEKVRLCDMEPGLFLFGDCLALKTEYMTNSGRIEAYIVDTGEFFHGGTIEVADQRVLMVQPLKVEPLVRCEGCGNYVPLDGLGNDRRCSIFCGCYDRPYPTEPDDFCSYGKQNDFPRITEQTQAALEAMGKKAHGGVEDGK